MCAIPKGARFAEKHLFVIFQFDIWYFEKIIFKNLSAFLSVPTIIFHLRPLKPRVTSPRVYSTETQTIQSNILKRYHDEALQNGRGEGKNNLKEWGHNVIRVWTPLGFTKIIMHRCLVNLFDSLAKANGPSMLQLWSLQIQNDNWDPTYLIGP